MTDPIDLARQYPDYAFVNVLLTAKALGTVDDLFDDLRFPTEPSPVHVPLFYTLPRGVVQNLYIRVAKSRHPVLRKPFALNLKEQKKYPSESELPLPDFIHAYLKNTPLLELFNTPVPLHIPREHHWHVVGGAGHGKTTLLENLIAHELQTDASIIVVDAHRDLIRKLARLKHEKNVVLISPIDTPALNVFAVNRERLETYDEATREQVLAGVIQTFDYLFSSLLGADLTAKQNVLFKMVARLLISLPETMGRNATILDMVKLMSDAGPYLPAIKALPPIQREFFERDFSSNTFKQTKEQIRYRLHAIIENPTLARLFTSEDTKIDLFHELNAGSVILIDTAKDFLKSSSPHFGQLWIALLLQSIFERAAIKDRRPIRFLIDEAHEYFSQEIDDLLSETRKYGCSLLLAHQYLDQAAQPLRASFHANCGVKCAGGTSVSDARAMSAEMRVPHDFILSQPKLTFAAHVRGMSHAVSMPVKLGSLDNLPKLSDEEYEALLKRNRHVVSRVPETTDPDVAEEW